MFPVRLLKSPEILQVCKVAEKSFIYTEAESKKIMSDSNIVKTVDT